MASRDPAFLWETEVLRETRAGSDRGGTAGSATMPDDGDWVTLKEASESTGVPAATIRKWARHANVPTFLEQTSEGFLRYVSMRGIREWSEEIGRELSSVEPTSAAESVGEIDLTEEERIQEVTLVPEGSMLVPLDAWNRMLNQLGNLHEAGQQLAEARERAAKAETEAKFLRERLGELREQLHEEKTRGVSTPVPPDAQGTTGAGAGLAHLARKAYADWKRRRSG